MARLKRLRRYKPSVIVFELYSRVGGSGKKNSGFQLVDFSPPGDNCPRLETVLVRVTMAFNRRLLTPLESVG